MTLEVPDEVGEYERGGYEVAVEGPTREFSGFETELVFEDTYVDVYEDTDGDFWLRHNHRADDHEDEGATLVTGYNSLYDVIEELVGD